jgi:hypothetical protein
MIEEGSGFGHLLSAAVTTAYIVVGALLEERDLADLFGDDYRRYKSRVSMLRPQQDGGWCRISPRHHCRLDKND